MEGFSQVELQGRAIGKSKNAIYLSTRTGIVEIPISEIENVKHLSTINKDVVSVVVRDSSKLQHKFQAGTNTIPIGPIGPIEPDGTSWTGSWTDTVTTSGSPPDYDQTDDVIWTEDLDDEGPV
jgi:hypothetical protein